VASKQKVTRRLCILEAALYSAGRPLSLDELSKVAGTKSERVIRRLVKVLSERYENRNGALEIAEVEGNRVCLQLKPTYDESVRMMSNKPLLGVEPLKTLSFVAYHQPITQKEIVEFLGRRVSKHLRMMESMGLVKRERLDGRSFTVTTTPFFADYFGFSHNPAKSKLQLKQIFSQLKITKLENGGIGEGFLADSGNGLPQGLPQYPGSADDSL